MKVLNQKLTFCLMVTVLTSLPVFGQVKEAFSFSDLNFQYGNSEFSGRHADDSKYPGKFEFYQNPQNVALSSLSGKNFSSYFSEAGILTSQTDHSEYIDPTISHNGNLIVSCSATACFNYDQRILLRDRDGNLIRVIRGHTNEVTSVKFTSDDAYIVSGGKDRSIRIFDLFGNQIRSWLAADDEISDLRVLKDNSILRKSDDGTIKLFDFFGKEIRTILRFKPHEALFMDLSSDETTLALTQSNKKVCLYSLDGKILSSYEFPNQPVAVSFDPLGTKIVVSTINSGLYLLDKSLHLIKQLRKDWAQYNPIFKVEFNNTGARIIYIAEYNLHFVDLNGNEDQPDKTYQFQTFTWTPDYQSVILGGIDRIFEYSLKQKTFKDLHGNHTFLEKVSANSQGEYFGFDDKNAKIIDVKSLTLAIIGGSSVVYNGDKVTDFTKKDRLVIQNIDLGTVLPINLVKDSSESSGVALSGKSASLVYFYKDILCFYDQKGEIFKTLYSPDKKQIQAVRFSSNGSLLLMKTENSRVLYEYSYPEGELVSTYDIGSVSFPTFTYDSNNENILVSDANFGSILKINRTNKISSKFGNEPNTYISLDATGNGLVATHSFYNQFINIYKNDVLIKQLPFTALGNIQLTFIQNGKFIVTCDKSSGFMLIYNVETESHVEITANTHGVAVSDGHNFDASSDNLNLIRLTEGVVSKPLLFSSPLHKPNLLQDFLGLPTIAKSDKNPVTHTTKLRVLLYEHSNYGGTSLELGTGRYTAKDLGAMDKNLSSLRVPKGLTITLYDQDNFLGNIKIINSDSSFVSDFNDKARSISIEYTDN